MLSKVRGLVLLLALSSAGCSSEKKNGQKEQAVAAVGKESSEVVEPVTHIKNRAQFKEAVSKPNKYVVVKFTAPWCSYCREIEPYVQAAAKLSAGQYDFISVNVDEVPDLAQEHRITGIPTIIFYRDGKEVTAAPRLEGSPVSSGEGLLEQIKASLSKAGSQEDAGQEAAA